MEYARTIKANDRATMLNLMVGLLGYTLCSGIICEELNGSLMLWKSFRSSPSHVLRCAASGQQGIASFASRKTIEIASDF